jgi:hypothetical protein
VTTNPNPFQFSKHGSGTVTFTVNPGGVVEFQEGPNNFEVTKSGTTFTVLSVNNTRGNFTLVFKTPCGTKNVSVTVVN